MTSTSRLVTRRRLFTLTEGQRIVLAYLIIAYILPMLGNVAFAEHIDSSFKIIPPTVFSVGSLLSVCGLFLVSSSVRTRVLPSIGGRFVEAILSSASVVYARSRFAIGAIGVVLGGMSFVSGLTSYRYSDVGISEIGATQGFLLVVVIVINLIITADFFYQLFVAPQERISRRRRIENIVLATALLIAADGNLSVIVALVAIVYALTPRYAVRMIFHQAKIELFRRWFIALSSIAVVLAIFFLSEVIGSIVKVGRATDFMSIVTDNDQLAAIIGMPVGQPILVSFWYHIVERASIFYYSFQLTADAAFDQLRRGEPNAFYYPIQTFFFRLDLLLGHPYRLVKPELGSLMGLNYNLLVAVPFGTRPGSAPGVLGSFSYVFPFPVNIIGAAIYLRWLANVGDALLVEHRGESLSLIGTGLVLMFLQVFFQSPFDFLMIVDGSVLYALMIVGMYLSKKRDDSYGYRSTAQPASRARRSEPIRDGGVGRPQTC